MLQKGSILRKNNGEIHVYVNESTNDEKYIKTIKLLKNKDKNEALAHHDVVKLEDISLRLEPIPDSISFIDIFLKLISMQNPISKYEAFQYYDKIDEDDDVYVNEPIPITPTECLMNVFSAEDLAKIFSEETIKAKQLFDDQLNSLINNMNLDYDKLREEYIVNYTNIVNIINEINIDS